MELKRISKFLSLVLRHDPGKIGITLDPHGWVDGETLLKAMSGKFPKISQQTLLEVVRTCDKQRFALSEDGTRIRANQGHSVEVDLDLVPVTPPAYLYHGTVAKFLADIGKDGLQKGKRHHVHLSTDLTTATKVGERRGAPVILRIRSGEMAEAGLRFFRSENGVWLCDAVPPSYIDFS
ncbi:MAG: phosphotransferase KptA/Tpt1 [Akkermansiaceae bacterium]|nr:phosphotransferase KptA/Tpt1 [Akkermansiaceae bacterium]